MPFQVDLVYIYYVERAYIIHRSSIRNTWMISLNLYIIIIYVCADI